MSSVTLSLSGLLTKLTFKCRRLPFKRKGDYKSCVSKCLRLQKDRN